MIILIDFRNIVLTRIAIISTRILINLTKKFWKIRPFSTRIFFQCILIVLTCFFMSTECMIYGNSNIFNMENDKI